MLFNSFRAPVNVNVNVNLNVNKGHGKSNIDNIDVIHLLVHLLHLSAWLLFIYGLILRSNLINGSECDMTYSHRQFIQINVVHNQKHKHKHYRLFKFVDARDPRHADLLRQSQFNDQNANEFHDGYCKKTANTLIYIPGHWGSYSQCRSIGAHGTTLTRINHSVPQLQSARNKLLNDPSQIFDVYCIDYAQQGAALHANFLYHQLAYLNSVLQFLQNKCHPTNVTLLGHSIGGLVAAALPVLYPNSKIKLIITLASPLSYLPYTFDQTLHRFYHHLSNNNNNNNNNTVPLLSISGGIRDELIPPQASSNGNHTLMVANLMPPTSSGIKGTYGMDHKAIVWCHNALQVVRALIMQHPTQMQSKQDYDQSVKQQYHHYTTENGRLASVALHSAMIYNAELLLSLYSLICSFRWAFVGPITSICLAVFFTYASSIRYIPLASVVILGLIANSVYSGLAFTLARFFASYCRKATTRLTVIRSMSLTLTLMTVLLVLSVVVLLLRKPMALSQVVSTIYISFIITVFVFVLSLDMTNQRNLSFAVFVLPCLPCLTFGKLVLYGWNLLSDGYWTTDVNFLLLVLLPEAIRIQEGHFTVSNQRWHDLDIPKIVVTAYFGTVFNGAGMGYQVGYLLSCMSLIDCFQCNFGLFKVDRQNRHEKD